MMIQFFKASNTEEREAVNLFLQRHNQRGQGSNRGYVAYYAAVWPPDGRSLVERTIAAAKFCPLHTPQAAKFFGGDDWRHVYCLQRLAAYRAPDNLLSKFLSWCLREMGRDQRVWYVATYADSNSFDQRTGRPHSGGIYRATNAVYCGLTQGGRVEAFILGGERRSLRQGPCTLTLAQIPQEAKLIRNRPMYRYCWATGSPLRRAFRYRWLALRMAKYKFEPVYQPRLLLKKLLNGLADQIWRKVDQNATP